MVSPIANSAASIRAQLNKLLWHRYTLTPVTAGSDDGYGASSTSGAASTGRPCRYETQQIMRTRDNVRILVETPTIVVPYDDTIKVNDEVSAILGSDAAVLLAGPLVVDDVISEADLGPVLQKRAILRGGDIP